MNNKRGMTVGAIVLTGVTGIFLRPLATFSAANGSAKKAAAGAVETVALSNVIRGEGPWIASCEYWAPVRVDERDDLDELKLSVKVDVDTRSFSASAAASGLAAPQPSGQSPDAVSCPGAKDQWGIPVSSTQKPQITAIIATVPDPTREHLALDFDHIIDGLLQAANDNGYLESYSWLPWKPPGESSVADLAATEREKEMEQKRLRQPGLIVLKYYDPSHNDYYKTLYLFLVGNTPMEGVEGDQLENALKYEAELQNEGGCFSPSVLQGNETCITPATNATKAPEAANAANAGTANTSRQDPTEDSFTPSRNALTVIGPNFSGAASSLKAQLESASREGPSKRLFPSQIQRINVFAEVGSSAARSLVEGSGLIHFVSFAGNLAFGTNQLEGLTCKNSNHERVVTLIEDNTAYGKAQEAQEPKEKAVAKNFECDPPWQVIKFPRGISLLRNAHEDELTHSGAEGGQETTPYLHMSLADKNDKGTIPQFSPQTATSQEAQLVTITQQLQRFRPKYIVVGGGNTLDSIFLARFLHRTFPDARLVSFGGDLLINRDTDNQPFVGALAIDAYPLLGPMPSDLTPKSARRPFASTITESVYNAASFALWDGTEHLKLANYRDIFAAKPGDSPKELYPGLWAMAVGRDAYYPVGLISRCASDDLHFLPLINEGSRNIRPCSNEILLPLVDSHVSFLEDLKLLLWPPALGKQKSDVVHFAFNPSRWWYLLCGAVLLACLAHVFCMGFTSFSSFLMRDLAIDEMNNPYRRAVFIHIGTVMLFGMAIVVSYPIFPVLRVTIPNPAAVWIGRATIVAGVLALLYSFWRTSSYAVIRATVNNRKLLLKRPDIYLVHAIAFLAMIGIPVLWMYACEGQNPQHVGLFFSYRCLNPLSGVSPLLPVLLLLFGWYGWSIVQTRRLRFSHETRPRIPGGDKQGNSFYVSDESLTSGTGGTDLPLYGNIISLFITPHLICRLTHGKLKTWQVWTLLGGVYGSLLLLCTFGLHPECMERLLGGPKFLSNTPFEWLVELLFFPLLLIALTGLLRLIVIWSALRRQLLRRLEFFPIRFAFGRMSTVGWISMMRQSDLLERQREMARSMESMRQLAHHHEIRELLGNNSGELEDVYDRTLRHVDDLRLAISNPGIRIIDGTDPEDRLAAVAFRKEGDIPGRDFEDRLRLMYYLESDFAFFAQQLLKFVLMPYWQDQRMESVESEERETTHARRVVPGQTEGPEFAIHSGLIKEPPLHICLAEEFVAIRYVSLIRAVLVNIRHLMAFVSFAWVLSMIAWNSYPFRPREAINLIFTLLFVLLGVGAIWVFSQMYRDVLLSRITRTEGNELGSEFYIRMAMFGAIPLLTWLAYQFPAVGAVVLKYLQPGIEAAK